MNSKPRDLAVWLAAFSGAIAVCFGPIVAGTFLFDDFANLKALGEYGAVSDLPALARYLSSGIADPLGRPVAMASFLLDARDWPADPAPFLRSNLILHVANGLLLALTLAKLGRLMAMTTREARKAALAGAALWALHPLWVSTVGYVVQRHAMLATTFVLLGILAWLLALASFRSGRLRHAWAWAGFVMPMCGILAALSKANGMLLPLLVLVLHYFMLASPGDRPAPERHAVRLMLVFPSILLVVGLFASIDPEPAGRPWLLSERLMSQPRAIVDYLTHLAIPRVNSVGLFADSFEISRSWHAPLSTLPAAFFVLALLAAPIALRRRHPNLAGALAFFLAGHAMESTVLPLELYFEHRNYLPAMLLGWPIAVHLLSDRWPRKTGGLVLGIALFVLACITYQRATLWADTPHQAAVWARTLPGSPRAQTWAAQHESERGQLHEAQERLAAALENHPRNLMVAVNLLDIECARHEISPLTVQRTATALTEAGAGDDVAQSWLRGKIQRENRYCPDLPPDILDKLLAASAVGSQASDLGVSRQRRLEGLLALSRGDCDRADLHFKDAQRAQRWSSEAYADAALLASHCGPEQALRYVDSFLASGQDDARERPGMLRLHQWLLRRQGYWQNELLRLQAILRAEVEDRPDGSQAVANRR